MLQCDIYIAMQQAQLKLHNHSTVEGILRNAIVIRMLSLATQPQHRHGREKRQ
jgi:hypothetical protein